MEEKQTTCEDANKEELQAICSIFPEAAVSSHLYSGSLQIPIAIDHEIRVVAEGDGDRTVVVNSLPGILFEFELPKGYPELDPPEFKITASWVPQTLFQELIDILTDVWRNMRDHVIYIMVDTISETIVNYLNELDDERLVVSDVKLLETLSKFDARRKVSEFNMKTFTCTICQEDKKGVACAEFPTCKHVFCLDCLKAYFTENLQSGDIEKVHCPDYECTKGQMQQLSQMLDMSSITSSKYDEWRNDLFKLPLPQDFLSKIMAPELVQRFVRLFNAQRFDILAKEFPAKVLLCPRTSCGVTFYNPNDDDTLAICPECHFAFCRECRHSWHGTTNVCKPVSQQLIPTEDIEFWLDSPIDSEARIGLSAKHGKRSMNIAVNAYLSEKAMEELLLDEKSDIQVCPNCRMLIQRSDGCNKMRCTKCQTMFCNICGDMLPSNDPYYHYKSFESTCHGKLFDGIITGENELPNAIPFMEGV